MKKNTFTRSILGLAVSAAMVAPAAFAEPVVDKGVTLSIGAGFTDFDDSKRGLTSHWGPELGIGYRFNDRFSVEGVYSEFKTTQKDSRNDARLRNYRIDGFYDLTPWDGSWTPYLVAGFGELQENLQHAKDRDDNRVNFGAGMRKSLHPNLSIRGDIRALRSLDYSQTEGMFNVALTYTFGTPAQPAAEAAPVVPVAEPLDSDNDGVIDEHDLCPNTPAGAVVDATGCVPEEEINLEVTFEFDSAKIKPTADSKIEEMAAYMKRHPDVNIRLEGHTDSQGDAGYNQKLSERRVQSVKAELVNKYGIDGQRIEAVGVGEADPIADNGSLEGRKMNRRVVAEVLK